MIIEIKNESQSRNIIKLKKLDKTAVSVQPHKTLNTIKGTIYYRNHPNYTTEELLDELKKSNVTEIYQTKRRINGTLMEQPIFILTFNLCNLPPDVKIGWTKCSVRQFIPRPRRCTKCQMFGHGVNACREECGTCYNCAEVVHELPCNNPPKCPNCEEQHPATSPSCFYFRLEQETLAMQYKERMSYPEAKRIVKTRFVRTKTTFSDAAKVQKIPTNELKDTTNTKPTVQQPRYSAPQTHASASSHPIRLTTGKVTLQPVERPPSRPTPPTLLNEDKRVTQTKEKPSNQTASSTKEVSNPTKNASKPPVISIETWEESAAQQEDTSRRDMKRGWTSGARAVSAERAAKRYPPPAKPYTFKRLPMPPNMPTSFPVLTKPPEDTRDQDQTQTTSTTYTGLNQEERR